MIMCLREYICAYTPIDFSLLKAVLPSLYSSFLYFLHSMSFPLLLLLLFHSYFILTAPVCELLCESNSGCPIFLAATITWDLKWPLYKQEPPLLKLYPKSYKRNLIRRLFVKFHKFLSVSSTFSLHYSRFCVKFRHFECIT